ncbi:hypothetical protein LB503_006439 [Fusarium chuoi]|nr:hypothetical protein LB503_006439 [Fusarium chuoi]
MPDPWSSAPYHSLAAHLSSVSYLASKGPILSCLIAFSKLKTAGSSMHFHLGRGNDLSLQSARQYWAGDAFRLSPGKPISGLV